MVPLGPLRDCQAIVVVHTAFLVVSSSSFQLGVFHHCVTESSVGIFEKHLTFFACFRLAGILFYLSATLCEKNCLLISSLVSCFLSSDVERPSSSHIDTGQCLLYDLLTLVFLRLRVTLDVSCNVFFSRNAAFLFQTSYFCFKWCIWIWIHMVRILQPC